MDEIRTTLPHAKFGVPDCGGYLQAVDVNGRAEILCNECACVVRVVPAIEVGRTLSEMELSLDCAREICSKCGAIHLVPGFARTEPFTCRKCGRGSGVPNVRFPT